MLDHHAIAARIRSLRGGMSQKESGDKLGFGQNFISEIERLKKKPSVEFLYALSREYGVTIDWILKSNSAGQNISISFANERIAELGKEFVRNVEEIPVSENIEGSGVLQP